MFQATRNAFANICLSLSHDVAQADTEADPRTDLDVDEEFEEQDRFLVEAEKNGQDNADATWEALISSIQKDAEGAHAKRTRDNYSSQILKLQKYADKYAIAHRDLTIVNEHTPHLICAWIKYYCGKPRSTCDRAANISDESIPLVPYNRGDAHSWSAASTMRAAASYMYIMKQSRQASSFQQSTDCKWLGNPCNSTFVRQYMKALKRQKAREGETPQSVMAITEEKIQQLYDENSKATIEALFNRANIQHDRSWGGPRKRLMMNLAYALSFLCLLRLDEVLNIKAENFHFHNIETGKLEIVLDFRKTQQAGEIQPFYLYYNVEKPWLDVPQLLLEWLRVSQIHKGYLFVPFFASDQPKISASTQKKLSHASFLQDFRYNLREVGAKYEMYGGHSFRRGGAQWFIGVKRWNVIKLCKYGGWSKEFDPVTIMRYLVAIFDEWFMKPEDYMDPHYQHKGEMCPACLRRCDCT